MALSHAAGLRPNPVLEPLVAAPGTGVLVLDSSLRAVSWNQEFLGIMSYPHTVERTADAQAQVAGYVKHLVRFRDTSASGFSLDEYVSGKRRYRCLSFAMCHGPRHMVVLLERSRAGVPSLENVIQQYGLTLREQQTLRCVLDGLSNKEAADRLNISPNTVKVFLRLLMMKMRVSSRSAIFSRLFGLHGLR
jgi:DNA-binding CsgD family transcriptional regulator